MSFMKLKIMIAINIHFSMEIVGQSESGKSSFLFFEHERHRLFSDKHIRKEVNYFDI